MKRKKRRARQPHRKSQITQKIVIYTITQKIVIQIREFDKSMRITEIITLVLTILKELFAYGKKAEKEKLEADINDRADDKLDWVRKRMQDTDQAGRDEETDSGE